MLERSHEKCGVNCIHLKRFYQKLGYDKAINVNKEPLELHASFIGSLPKIKKSEIMHAKISSASNFLN